MRLLAVSLALIVFSMTCYAADYYVAMKGCADSGKGTESEPWCTIQKAARTARAGDTVYVKEGTYKGEIKFEHSGKEDNWITFRNYNDDKVTIRDGNFFGFSVSYIRMQGFHITHPPYRVPAIRFYGNGGHIEILDNEVSYVNTSWHGAVEVGGSVHDFRIDGNHVHNCSTGTAEAIKVFQHARDFKITNNLVEGNTNIGIVVNGWSHWGKPKNGVISGNIVRFNSKKAPWSAGIYLDCTNDMIVENNIAYGNIRGLQLGCEQPKDIAENNIVRYNIAYENTGAGMQVGGYQGGMTRNNEIYGNLFYDNGLEEIGFETTPGEENYFYNNIFSDPGTTLIDDPGESNHFDHNLFHDRRGPGQSSIVGDPGFRDAAKKDFSLKKGSPACGKGRDGADIGPNRCGCGDGKCSSDEDCENCPQDCECECEPEWRCGEWTLCWEGKRTRTCIDGCGESRHEEEDCSKCVHEADNAPCDGCVSSEELSSYIRSWKSGNGTFSGVLGALVRWMRGC
jgi:hypothetical protein